MNIHTFLSAISLVFFANLVNAQDVKENQSAQELVVKTPTKERIFKDNMDKEIHIFKGLSPNLYLFQDKTEKRSGYGVWWCANTLAAHSRPIRFMFLSGLNGEGDYLLYFSNPSETRNGNTQRFSPALFKSDGKGMLEKVQTEASKIEMKFESKLSGGEMTSVAFTYSSPTHREFKYFTRENCEKY